MFARFMWSLVVVVRIIMTKTGGHGSEGVTVLCYGFYVIDYVID